MIHTVFFDVGETLVDETRWWAEAAHRLGVTPLTLMGVLGAVIERGADHREAFAIVRPDARPSLDARVTPDDLYPDALGCLRALRAAGYAIGLAGNTSESVEASLHGLGVDVDHIASSARWGVEKPSPMFFERIVAEAGVPAAEIAYVGDRLDNDVLPAKRAGMLAIFIRRGPWGFVHAQRAEAAEADLTIDSLEALPTALARARAGPA
jgi:FMN phosphatase YigB (HAD superfamily)